MVHIYCEEINEDVLNSAYIIARNQKENVVIKTPTKTLEVKYEKEEEQETD